MKIPIAKKLFSHPVTITYVIYLVFFVIQLWQYGWDVSGFIHAGDYFTKPEKNPMPIQVIPNSYGYDGQFYYRIALNPFSIRDTDYGITMDVPRYRFQRILYPFLVWMISFGAKSLIPANMVIVNFVFLGILAFIGGNYAKNHGYPHWLGIILPLYSGFFVTLSRDLTEITAAALMVAGFYLFSRDRYTLTTVLLSLAVFAKETTLLAAIGAFLFLFWKRDKRWLFFLVPICFYFLWQLFLNLIWARTLGHTISYNISFPFMGIVSRLIDAIQQWAIVDVLFLVDLVILVGFLYFVGKNISAETLSPIEVSWLIYGLLMVCMTTNIWLESVNYFRALSEFYLLGIIMLYKTHNKQNFYILRIASFIWLPFALLLVFLAS